MIQHKDTATAKREERKKQKVFGQSTLLNSNLNIVLETFFLTAFKLWVVYWIVYYTSMQQYKDLYKFPFMASNVFKLAILYFDK